MNKDKYNAEEVSPVMEGCVVDTESTKAPTTILSDAIEQVEQMGNFGVMVALVDRDTSKPKEERLYTFCDINSKKLREVIYKEMEGEF